MSMVSSDDEGCCSSTMKGEGDKVEERIEEIDNNANHQQNLTDTLRSLCTYIQCLINKKAELQVTVNENKQHCRL